MSGSCTSSRPRCRCIFDSHDGHEDELATKDTKVTNAFFLLGDSLCSTNRVRCVLRGQFVFVISVASVSGPDKSPDRIAGMFDAIAPRYDLLNHLLSAGIDRRWRAAAIRSLQLTGQRDAARRLHRHRGCGSGSRLRSTNAANFGAAQSGDGSAARVVGVDFAGAMLALGLQKVRAAGEATRIALLRGDAMRLPAADRSRRRRDRRVRHPQRPAAGGGVRGDGARAAPGRPAGDSRVRRPAHPRNQAVVPLVLHARAAVRSDVRSPATTPHTPTCLHRSAHLHRRPSSWKLSAARDLPTSAQTR